MRETARRMHLASRTVAYRLERIEEVLGRPIDGEIRPRLSVALLEVQLTWLLRFTVAPDDVVPIARNWLVWVGVATD